MWTVEGFGAAQSGSRALHVEYRAKPAVGRAARIGTAFASTAASTATSPSNPLRVPVRIARPLGWTLLVILCVVLLVFSLIGILHTFRGTPIARIHLSGTGEIDLAAEDSSFRTAAEALTGVSLAEGNEVEILLNEEVLRRLFTDLRNARSTIAIRNYYALPGRVADSLGAILSERASAGVQVLYLYDAFGSDFAAGYLARLESAGVEVRAFRPLRWFDLSRAQNRSHVRAVIVDGVVGYTGGYGIADLWLGDGVSQGSWRETSVRFTGPAVRQLQSAFSIGWAEATGTLLVGPRYYPPGDSVAAGGSLAGLLYAVPTQGSTQAERFLLLSILGARRTLYVTNSYFVPDDDQRRLLAAAARRGVDVRILTAGRHTDIPLARLAGRAHYASLLRSGVRIYEYQPSMVHAKTLVADGHWATVGTMNFDNRSAALNEESNLLMLDRALGARLDTIFLRDLRHARELRLEEFARRPWHEKVKERAATLLSRVL